MITIIPPIVYKGINTCIESLQLLPSNYQRTYHLAHTNMKNIVCFINQAWWNKSNTIFFLNYYSNALNYECMQSFYFYFRYRKQHLILLIFKIKSAKLNKIIHIKMFANLWTEISLLRTNYPILSPAILVFIGLQIYYRVVVVKPTELHCKQNSLYHVSLIQSQTFKRSLIILLFRKLIQIYYLEWQHIIFLHI